MWFGELPYGAAEWIGRPMPNFEQVFHEALVRPQFYIQLVFKAPLCTTLTISDQKIVSGSLFFQLFVVKKIKAILCNFSMRTLKYFLKKF